MYRLSLLEPLHLSNCFLAFNHSGLLHGNQYKIQLQTHSSALGNSISGPKYMDNYPDISLGLKNQLIDSYFNGLMNDNSICEFSIKNSQINKSIRFRYDPVTSLQIRDL